MAIIAKIELTPDTISWYDELTNIHLHSKQPSANVTSDMKLTNIKRGLAYQTIRVCEGFISTAPEGSCDFDASLYLTKEEIETVYATKKEAEEIAQNITCDFDASLYLTKEQVKASYATREDVEEVAQNVVNDFGAYT